MSASSAEANGNRLSIALFLLWISSIAVVLAAFRPALAIPVLGNNVSSETRQHYQRQQQIALFAYPTLAPIWGTALAAVVLAGWRFVRRQAGFPTQPGHFLLVIVGSFAIAVLPIFSAPQLSAFKNLVINVVWFAAFALPYMAILLAAFMCRDYLHWQILFGAIAIGAAILFAGILLDTIAFQFHSHSGMGLFLSLSGVAVVLLSSVGLFIWPFIDLFSYRRYDWLHWIGASMAPVHLLWVIAVLFGA